MTRIIQGSTILRSRGATPMVGASLAPLRSTVVLCFSTRTHLAPVSPTLGATPSRVLIQDKEKLGVGL